MRNIYLLLNREKKKSYAQHSTSQQSKENPNETDSWKKPNPRIVFCNSLHCIVFLLFFHSCVSKFFFSFCLIWSTLTKFRILRNFCKLIMFFIRFDSECFLSCNIYSSGLFCIVRRSDSEHIYILLSLKMWSHHLCGRFSWIFVKIWGPIKDAM